MPWSILNQAALERIYFFYFWVNYSFSLLCMNGTNRNNVTPGLVSDRNIHLSTPSLLKPTPISFHLGGKKLRKKLFNPRWFPYGLISKDQIHISEFLFPACPCILLEAVTQKSPMSENSSTSTSLDGLHSLLSPSLINFWVSN